jgi:putative addiction module killer protein
MGYTIPMFEVRQTAEFSAWLRELRDERAQGRITERVQRVAAGNLGDWKIFEGLLELRIDYGPGYRLYAVRRGPTVLILLCGGHKGSQKRNIKHAKKLARQLE